MKARLMKILMRIMTSYQLIPIRIMMSYQLILMRIINQLGKEKPKRKIEQSSLIVLIVLIIPKILYFRIMKIQTVVVIMIPLKS